MPTPRIQARLSDAIRAILNRASSNDSEAIRAYLLLGMHAAGEDISACANDLALLRLAKLPHTLAERLAALERECTTGVRQVYDRPTAPQKAGAGVMDDPFGVGIEV